MKYKFFLIVCVCFSLLSAGFLGSFFVYAQTADADPCSANIAGESHAQLQTDLDACTADIAKWTAILDSTKANTASYQTEVITLTAQINAAQANIKAKNIAIANLGADISAKQTQITVLQGNLDADTASLAELIRKTNEIDSFTLADAILSSQNLSDFFSDSDAYSTISNSLESVQDDLRGVKTQTQKDALNEQLSQTADAKAAIVAAQAQVEQSQAEQKTLLAQSQSQEATFASVVAAKQAKADQIRAALFNLRDTAAIPFGTALQYAQIAQKATGVDPAFLLAIMTQESNLGANVGQCNLPTSPDSAKWFSIMPGPTAHQNYLNDDKSCGPHAATPCSSRDDQTPYQQIMSSLGRDPASMPLSCPIPSAGPWGGAMGPAQFIPSTWVLFTARIISATGDANPDPWSAKDAFAASAFYLSDLGAGTGTYTDEENAACRYYTGQSCSNSTAKGYGLSVMEHAATIQTTMIDPLQGV
jgi:peptidoglycan hydrolase CwlO-like protein